ncbi:phage tail protein [Phyllobacterium myrsinacearum]|uniref:Phage-related protein n=1 Tax=Phyllobacterium myrsinacearum TaxID=28101 RepID=A0A839ESF5_9HYPH|nr:phage tail protein [Phyllobacterium myrsinacearum]MBA8881732.1 phage-related protein [Phyllobacterium myrsinacearum]
MTLPIFEPSVPPSSGTRHKPEIKLLEAEFGDGYTQSARRGINHLRRTLALSWDKLLPWQEAEIMGFLTERGGDRLFYFTPTGERKALKWTCQEFDSAHNNDGFQVSATFKQSFNLEN